MKTAIIIIIVFVFTTFNSFSQEKGNIRFSFQSDYSSYNQSDLQFYGISWEIFIGRHFTLDYHYSIGNNQYGEKCYYFPGSMAVMVMAYGEDILYDPYFFEDNAELFLLSLIIPEGISYHAYPRRWLELAPFIYPLSSNYNFSGYHISSIILSFGFKVYFKPIPNLSISPIFGLQKKYSNGETSQNVGIAVGWLF